MQWHLLRANRPEQPCGRRSQLRVAGSGGLAIRSEGCPITTHHRRKARRPTAAPHVQEERAFALLSQLDELRVRREPRYLQPVRNQ